MPLCVNISTCAEVMLGKTCAASSISHDVNTNGAVSVGRLKRPVIVPIKAVTIEEKAVAKSMTKKLIGEPLKGLIGQRNPTKTPITAKAVRVPFKPYSPIRTDDLSAWKAIAANVAERVPMNAVIPAKYIGYCTGKPYGFNGIVATVNPMKIKTPVFQFS